MQKINVTFKKLNEKEIIDLTNNFDFIRELENNLRDRIKDIQAKGFGDKRIIKIRDASFDIEIANQNLDDYNKKIKNLRDFYIEEIKKRIPYIRINGDLENRLPGNANICFKGIDGGKLISELDKKGICASSGSACSAGLLNPSHVLLSIGVPINLARGSLRVTFGKENNCSQYTST